MAFPKYMKVITLTDFEDHFDQCLPNDIWSHHLNKLGLPFSKWNYRHSYRYSKKGGLEVIIRFRPSAFESLYIHFKRDYIEFSYFTRDDLRSKYSLPETYCKMYLKRKWYEQWPAKTIDKLLTDSPPHRVCHKPIVF